MSQPVSSSDPGFRECAPDALEALVRDELSALEVDALKLHVAGCVTCREELSWLRSERELMQRRLREASALPPALWQGVERRLQQEAVRRQRAQPFWTRVGARAGGWAAAAAVLAGFFVVQHVSHLGTATHGKAGFTDSDPPPSSHGFHIQVNSGPSLSDDVARAKIAVTAPPRLRLKTESADVDVRIGEAQQVALEVSDGAVQKVKLESEADGVITARFDSGASLPSGDVRLWLPLGSALELTTVSGDIKIAAGLGALRLHTASGGTEVALRADAAPELDFQSASGDLTLSGPCAAGCRIHAASASGDMDFHLRADSAFTLAYSTASGDLTDELGLQDHKRGSGAGRIEVSTASGDLHLRSQ